MHISKALAALSAGALLLIGQSAVAQDPYTDSTATEAEQERTDSSTDTRPENERMQDDEFSASTETQWDTESDTTSDEFSAKVETDTDDEFATEDEWSTETESSTESDMDIELSSNSQVDDEKLETLAQIHLDMQNEIRELADELAVAASAEEAQEFQARMVDRQVQVIERHGWSRDEYNDLVDQVNDNPDLRAQFINMVVARDEQVAQFNVETDTELQAEADLDEEDDWMSDEETTASVEIEDEDDRVVAEDERDW